MAAEAVRHVAVVLNERLGGLTLREIRGTLSDRLRDAAGDSGAHELLNIFIQEADELFDVPASAAATAGVVLGSAQLLAGQPEFATQERLQGLLEVTERRDLLRQALAKRLGHGLTITIASLPRRRRRPKRSSRRSRRRTRCCVIPRSAPRTIGTAWQACAGRERRAGGSASRTSTSPRRSTSSCATSAAWADWTPSSAAASGPDATASGGRMSKSHSS